MTSSTQNKIFKKILINTNPQADIGAVMAFGLGVR